MADQSWFSLPHSRLHVMSGYAQSKWVSERLVLQAIHSGILAGNVSRYNIPHIEALYQFISVMYQATEYGVVWALTQAHKFKAVSLSLHIGPA